MQEERNVWIVKSADTELEGKHKIIQLSLLAVEMDNTKKV